MFSLNFIVNAREFSFFAFFFFKVTVRTTFYIEAKENIRNDKDLTTLGPNCEVYGK